MKEELQNLYTLLKWSNTPEANAVLNSPPHPHTALDTLWGIVVILIILTYIFSICFVFKNLFIIKLQGLLKPKGNL